MSIENEINEIDQKIAELNKQKQEKLDTLKEMVLKQNWEEVKFNVKNLTREQCLCQELDKDAKTIPLFDSFLHSTYKYLLLENAFRYNFTLTSPSLFDLCDSRAISAPISLVIIKHWKRFRRENCGLTISKIKEHSNKSISKIKNLNHINDSLKKLLDEIENTFTPPTSIEIDDFYSEWSEKFYPLQNPISLNAQTSKNRQGYGNIYNGQELIHEGTKYGETTEFIIVGIMVEYISNAKTQIL